MHIQSTFKLWFVSFSGGACIGADYSVRSCLITVGITEGRWEVREDCDEEKEKEEGGDSETNSVQICLVQFKMS